MSDDLMPERIWIKPCSPCDLPDEYYVCDPRYLDGRGTSYVKSDVRCAGCNGGLYRRGNTMICRDCGKAEEWPDAMGRADELARLRAEVERLKNDLAFAHASRLSAEDALADERTHADARADAFREAAGLAKQYEECWPNAAAPDARQDLKDQYRDMAYAARIIKSVILAHINEPQEGGEC